MGWTLYQLYLRRQLARAIVHGNVRRCQYYVEKGASLKHGPRTGGLTPLQLAIANNRPVVVAYLLNAGAVQTPLPVTGVSCLVFAIGLWRSHVYAICQALLEDGIAINNNGTCDPLYFAMLKQDPHLTQLLLAHGACRTDPRVTDFLDNLSIRSPNNPLSILFV